MIELLRQGKQQGWHRLAAATSSGLSPWWMANAAQANSSTLRLLSIDLPVPAGRDSVGRLVLQGGPNERIEITAGRAPWLFGGLPLQSPTSGLATFAADL